MRSIVLTVDQRGSSRSSAHDLVPATLAELRAFRPLRGFERTAGDEFQGVVEAAALAPVLERLLRESTWSIGVGVGDVDDPLPVSTREGRGPAFVSARDAVTAAKSAPWHVAVRGDHPQARMLESAIWLWANVLGRRTTGGWEVADLVDSGLRYDDVASRLGITPSAVSQRAATAGIVEGRRARELVTHLATEIVTSADRSMETV